MDDFEKEVLDLAQGTLPIFKQTNVRAHVATLLVDPNRVEKLRAFKKHAKTASTVKDKQEKYCKSCECKHAKGKHTVEGKRRYQERIKTTESWLFHRGIRSGSAGQWRKQEWQTRRYARQKTWKVQCMPERALPLLPSSARNVLRLQEGPQTFLQTGILK